MSPNHGVSLGDGEICSVFWTFWDHLKLGGETNFYFLVE